MLGPDSETWRHILDWRLLLGSGRALLLQVAHPTVGAGVAQHSDFQSRPWQRLERTVDSLMLMNYGGADTVTEAKRLRELHRDIKGIDHHGHRYHALNPEAYTWVHATLFEASLDLHATFGKPLSLPQKQRLFEEWRELGEVLGLKPHHMPADLPGFFEYFDNMVDGTLEDNETVRTVLASISDRKPVRPPRMPKAAWRAIGPLSAAMLTAVTIGTLPPVFRDRLGLAWTERDQRKLKVIQVAVRGGMPLVPGKLRYHPMALAAKRAVRT